MNADGANARQLTRIFTRGGTIVGPRWSPDAKRIAFAWRSAVWVTRADGSDLRRLIG